MQFNNKKKNIHEKYFQRSFEIIFVSTELDLSKAERVTTTFRLFCELYRVFFIDGENRHESIESLPFQVELFNISTLLLILFTLFWSSKIYIASYFSSFREQHTRTQGWLILHRKVREGIKEFLMRLRIFEDFLYNK